MVVSVLGELIRTKKRDEISKIVSFLSGKYFLDGWKQLEESYLCRPSRNIRSGVQTLDQDTKVFDTDLFLIRTSYVIFLNFRSRCVSDLSDMLRMAKLLYRRKCFPSPRKGSFVIPFFEIIGRSTTGRS